MTDKEKLVALVGKARLAMWGKRISCRLEAEYFFAEYLLAHGVTIREQGEWEIVYDDDDNEMMRCSRCKSEFYDGDNDTVDQFPNFCPNCGAPMKKVE